jgi:diguanylate cyclase (GGDEF)-like protein
MPVDPDRPANPPEESSQAEGNGGPSPRRSAVPDREASDLEQTFSDLDQSASEGDQAAADEDQGGSDLDQSRADIDQLASNRDQATADREMTARGAVDVGSQRAYDVARSERELGTREREGTTASRVRTAAERLENATRRNESARMRDLAAQARDRAADARDHAAAEREAELGPRARTLDAHQLGRSLRAQAAADRARAAADRDKAAHDREQATADLKQAEADLQHAHIDELTGAYVRGAGTMALEKEIERARHADERLVLAYIDVDDLKQANDRHGHGAGDAILRHVVEAIRSKLRSYDPIARVGGDEFICAISGIDQDMGRHRFGEISEALRAAHGVTISVGLAGLGRGDTLADLRERGDAALYRAKHDRGATA